MPKRYRAAGLRANPATRKVERQKRSHPALSAQDAVSVAGDGRAEGQAMQSTAGGQGAAGTAGLGANPATRWAERAKQLRPAP